MTPEWIVEKTGIEQRYAGPEESASQYAVLAAQRDRNGGHQRRKWT
jgi:3-oxoacyl-[acyl-carrier-protein] synthase-3